MALPDSKRVWPTPTLNAEPDGTLSIAAGEREKAAEERARELVKANQALQATIDVLRESGDLDQLEARVLQIAAKALGSNACAVFESEPSGLVRLKYWSLHGEIFPPEKLVHVKNPEVVPRLAAGFTVPDSYLGGFAPHVLGPVVLDHRSGTSVPEFDRFAVANGWDWELNIGVPANGPRAFSFCVYRSREYPFGKEEIALADSLSKQLGLAVETRRLAERARETTLAQEREKAAKERVRELAKVNETLRRGLDRFADLDHLDGYATSLIQEAAAVFGADSAAVFVREGWTTAFRPVAVVTDGHLWSAGEIAADPFLGTYTEASARDPAGILSRLIEQSLTNYTLLDEHLAKIWPAAYDFHARRYGHRISRQFPLRLRGRMLGFFAFALRRIDSPTPTQMESVAALAQQFTLALEMTRLADKARETALAREREQAAQERAAELAKVNRSLRESVHVVAHSANFDQSLAEVVLRISATAEAQMGALFVYDETANALCCEFWFDKGTLHWGGDPNGPPCMRGPFDADVTPAFRHYATQQQIMYVNLQDVDETSRTAAWPGVLDWHVANGRRATCAIPVSADRTLGVIGLGWNENVAFSPEQLEVLMALSNHAALVMQLRHMERAARAATIAREQEQAAQARAAELAQLNTELQTRSRLLEVVAQVSGLLARSPDFECALLDALRLIGEAAQLSRVLVLLARSQRQNPSEREHHVIAEWCASGVRTHAECGLEVISDEDARQFVERLNRGGSFWVHTREVERPLRDYFEQLDIVGTGCAPIFLDNQYAGVIAFDDCFAPRTTETAQVDALTAAANTVAAALQSRRDTERLLCERELAAQERAAELAKANDALKQTLDVVAFEPNLNQVLGHVLASITQQLGSPSSALWLWEEDSGKFRTHLVFHEGRVLELTNENRKLLQGVWGRGRGLQWNDHIRERKPVVYQVADLEGAQERAFFQRLGIQSLLGIPLLLGSEIVGSITIRFDTARTLQLQELELAQALAHQATMAVQLTRLAERAGEAALSEERARFAREIHDTLAQGFTGILMQLGAISQIEGDRRGDIQPQLTAMTALAQASLAEARRSVRAFRPIAGPSDFHLDRAVEQFVEKARLQTEATVTLAMEGTPPSLSQRAAGELSGIVQEALNNAVKHANAKHISVSLYFEGHPGVSISIEDDGVGFDAAAQTGSDCFGLIGMQERAASIGASLTVVSERGRGTEIVLQYTAA